MFKIGHWFYIPGRGWFEGSTAAAGSGAAGCAIPLLIIGIISFWLASFIRPTYEYNGEAENSNAWKSAVTMGYQKWLGADSIFGLIDYTESRRGSSGAYRKYNARTTFRGTLIDGIMTIELKDRRIDYETYPLDADYFPTSDGLFPELITLREDGDNIYFDQTMKVGEVRLVGGKQVLSTLWAHYDR
jgi:hypothetical protein